MEYLTGVLVTFLSTAHLQGKHYTQAEMYLKWVQEDNNKLEDPYNKYRRYYCEGIEQFKFLLSQFCTKTVLEEMEAIISLKHPSKEYRYLILENDVVVIYAVGHIAYMLTLALAFGFDEPLGIRNSYVC